MRRRWFSIAMWCVAFVVTVALAFFQRLTGPTHPMRAAVTAGSLRLDATFLRSHGGDGGLPVEVQVAGAGEDLEANVRWRRYPTDEAWTEIGMERSGSKLSAEIPHQPPAGKVEYRIVVGSEGHDALALPGGEAVVARFRGDVPARVLIPHILAMFLSMLFATRSMLEIARRREPDARSSVLVATGLLIVGGLILGPVVQKHAFDAYWTGWPFGTDLTDNKTLIAFLAWLPATVFALRGRFHRVAVGLGWLVMMGVFLIPHSMHGSEIDWSVQEPQASHQQDPR